MAFEFDSIERYLRKFTDFDFRYTGEYRYLIKDNILTIKFIKREQIRFFYKETLIGIRNVQRLNREDLRKEIYKVVQLARKLISRYNKRRKNNN